MEADQQPKVGRKRKYETKRPQLSVRLRADIHEWLRARSQESGFSLSEEIERRLEASYVDWREQRLCALERAEADARANIELLKEYVAELGGDPTKVPQHRSGWKFMYPEDIK